jgi:hypothetical protein
MEPVCTEARRWLAGQPVPSLEEFHARFGHTFRNYRLHWDDPISSYPEQLSRIGERDRFICDFGFSIPTAEALAAVAALSPLVEIGAGTGLWSALLRRHGADIIATDVAPAGRLNNYRFVTASHAPTEQLAAKTAVRRYYDRNAFCSWPSYDATWFRQALKAMRIGRAIAVVREDATGDETAWSYLEQSFQQEKMIEIPCWYGLHDVLEIWRKKRNAPRSFWCQP